MITVDVKGFAQEVARIREEIEDKTVQTTKDIVLDLVTRVAQKTPYLSGQAKSNWFTQIGSVSNATQRFFKGQSLPPQQAEQSSIDWATVALQGLEPGDVVYISNALPYAERLENGYSDQAPAGMLALSVEETELAFRIVR